MKNLYVSLVAASLIVSGCSRSSNNPNANKANQTKKSGATPDVTEDALLVNAIAAFTAQGYDANTPENKALAEDIAGAEMQVEHHDETSKIANFQVILASSCEMFSKRMHGNTSAEQGNKGKGAEVTPRTGDMNYPAGYADLENKCIGAGGGCDHVAVLFSKRDMNGGKPAQVVIAFKQNEKGSYDLVGWPTSKKGVFKSVSAYTQESKQCAAQVESVQKQQASVSK